MPAFCYTCGAEATVDGNGIPSCSEHGSLWRLVRNAPCADVLVVRGDRVLLTRRAKDPYAGYWETPGGFQNDGEHPSDAARREAMEELGINVKLTGILGIYVDRYDDEQWTQTIVYLAETDDEPRVADGEIEEWRWFGPDELPTQMAFKHGERLQDWLALRAAGTRGGLRLDTAT
jgi:ADP-ribose pyrophosphatase YjhB (NUDIX family)